MLPNEVDQSSVPRPVFHEMRDVIALQIYQSIIGIHETPDQIVDNAEEDANDAYEAANTFLRVRKERKDAFKERTRVP